MRSLTKLLAVIFAALFFNNIANAACGKITYANMNWASASLMANIDKIILEKGYGCEVELLPGDTMPSFTSMNEKGQPDVAPELWANSVMSPLKKAVGEGRIHIVNKGPITGLGEGWFVPPYTMEKHGIKTVQDLLKRPDLFPHPEDKSKGAFVDLPCDFSNTFMIPDDAVIVSKGVGPNIAMTSFSVLSTLAFNKPSASAPLALNSS